MPAENTKTNDDTEKHYGSVPEEFRSYWQIGDDILFLLDNDLKPRVGTASWSYVLNRIR